MKSNFFLIILKLYSQSYGEHIAFGKQNEYNRKSFCIRVKLLFIHIRFFRSVHGKFLYFNLRFKKWFSIQKRFLHQWYKNIEHRMYELKHSTLWMRCKFQSKHQYFNDDYEVSLENAIYAFWLYEIILHQIRMDLKFWPFDHLAINHLNVPVPI